MGGIKHAPNYFENRFQNSEVKNKYNPVYRNPERDDT